MSKETAPSSQSCAGPNVLPIVVVTNSERGKK